MHRQINAPNQTFKQQHTYKKVHRLYDKHINQHLIVYITSINIHTIGNLIGNENHDRIAFYLGLGIILVLFSCKSFIRDVLNPEGYMYMYTDLSLSLFYYSY